MNSTERVRNAILGKPIDRQPIYGWVEWNMREKINSRWGSAAAMEDYYEFDAAHIFGGPPCFNNDLFEELRARAEAEPSSAVKQRVDKARQIQ